MKPLGAVLWKEWWRQTERWFGAKCRGPRESSQWAEDGQLEFGRRDVLVPVVSWEDPLAALQRARLKGMRV